MEQVKLFRENTRRLKMNLADISKTECCGVSEAQCFVLVGIGRNADISGISRTVEELVQKGFVKRNPSKEDRRYVVLNLTKKGSEKYQKIENDMNRKFAEILDRIPEDKRDQVIDSLQLFNAACSKEEI